MVYRPTRRVLVLPLLLAVALIASIFGGLSRAEATSVAYIDGNEVWLSSLDAKRKVRLSSGEGEWRAVAAADSGAVLGVRLESGKIFQLSQTKLWDGSGKGISQGPLPSENAGWSSYVAPLGLDLSSDGVFLAYGYSGYTGIVPNANFWSGHYVVNADTKTLIQPIGQTGYEWPSMFGRRVVAASGSNVVIQEAGSGPFGQVFQPILDTSGTGLELGRSDISADGKMIAIELGGGPSDRIAVVSLGGVDPPVTVGATVDCFLPTSGDASSVTFSQDGNRIAWEDDDGVKIAGAPTTLADPCVFSSPPVLISQSGSSPSIGGAALPVVAPPPGSSPNGPFEVKLKLPFTGRVRFKGTVPAARLGLTGPPRLCFRGKGKASRAGRLKLKLRPLAKCRGSSVGLKGAKVRLKLSNGKREITRSVKLR